VALRLALHHSGTTEQETPKPRVAGDSQGPRAHWEVTGVRGPACPEFLSADSLGRVLARLGILQHHRDSAIKGRYLRSSRMQQLPAKVESIARFH
jgi:hypothetical protein